MIIFVIMHGIFLINLFIYLFIFKSHVPPAVPQRTPRGENHCSMGSMDMEHFHRSRENTWCIFVSHFVSWNVQGPASNSVSSSLYTFTIAPDKCDGCDKTAFGLY